MTIQNNNGWLIHLIFIAIVLSGIASYGCSMVAHKQMTRQEFREIFNNDDIEAVAKHFAKLMTGHHDHQFKNIDKKFFKRMYGTTVESVIKWPAKRPFKLALYNDVSDRIEIVPDVLPKRFTLDRQMYSAIVNEWKRLQYLTGIDLEILDNISESGVIPKADPPLNMPFNKNANIGVGLFYDDRSYVGGAGLKTSAIMTDISSVYPADFLIISNEIETMRTYINIDNDFRSVAMSCFGSIQYDFSGSAINSSLFVMLWLEENILFDSDRDGIERCLKESFFWMVSATRLTEFEVYKDRSAASEIYLSILYSAAIKSGMNTAQVEPIIRSQLSRLVTQ